jgi:vancomycin permeability regulator SanA
MFTKFYQIITRIFVVILLIDILLCVGYFIFSFAVVRIYQEDILNDVGALFFANATVDGTLSDSTLLRVHSAQEAFNSGKIKNILCLGGTRSYAILSGAQMMCDYLEKSGVPKGNLFVDNASWDSTTNLIELERIANEKQWQKVAFISSPIHMPRLIYLARDSERVITLLPNSIKESIFDLLGLWLDVHHEFLAWGAYMILPRDFYSRVMGQIRGVSLK